MPDKKKKKSDYNADDAVRDVGPIYTDSKGRKSQIPSKEMYDLMHPSDEEVKREAHRFDNFDKVPTMENMPYYPEKDSGVMTNMPYYPEKDSGLSIPMSGRSPEDYKSFKETPYEKRSYKDGGDIHIEKGHNYIKDLIK